MSNEPQVSIDVRDGIICAVQRYIQKDAIDKKDIVDIMEGFRRSLNRLYSKNSAIGRFFGSRDDRIQPRACWWTVSSRQLSVVLETPFAGLFGIMTSRAYINAWVRPRSSSTVCKWRCLPA